MMKDLKHYIEKHDLTNPVRLSFVLDRVVDELIALRRIIEEGPADSPGSPEKEPDK